MQKFRFYVDSQKAAEKVPGSIPVKPVIKNPTGMFGDVGVDLFAAYDFIVEPHSMYITDTFIGFLFDVNTAGQIWPRSGDNFLVGAGIIDTGYVGTVKVKIINYTNYVMEFKQGDSVGQMVLFTRAYIEGPELKEVDKEAAGMLKTDRGENGRINTQFNLQ